MLALNGQPCLDPVLLALGVVAHVCVSHRRQLTGSVLRSVSREVGAVDYNLGLLIGQERWRKP